MNLSELIQHPEMLNKETLYDLRSLIAQYPYYQPARLLMLQNLYLLHDPTFDEELRRAAVYVTDRKVIFNLVEAAHYKLKQTKREAPSGNRTVSLIDDFLSSIPEESEENIKREKPTKREPTATDATVDYVAYLLATGFGEEDNEPLQLDDNGEVDTTVTSTVTSPTMKGQDLIDDFINKDGGKMSLKNEIEYSPQSDQSNTDDEREPDEEFFTETLAGIYIKQGKYSQALEIIKRLNLDYPKKNVYFADQIRFLEKLIANSKKAR